jgi:hypothetical protein
VLEEGSSAAEAFLASFGFCLARLRKALTVYALPSILGIALLVVYKLSTAWLLPNASLAWMPWARAREPLALAILFIVQQAVMFGRYWFRVATWASEWSLIETTN